MNRIVRLARFEAIYDREKNPSRAKFEDMFRSFGFTADDFRTWETDRKWAT